MSEPTSLAEYTARFNANTEVTGYGTEVAMHVPCPFCAAPDWAVWALIRATDAMREDRTCRECGRSARSEVMALPGGGTSVELVQTGGPDAPPWLDPPPRRVSAGGQP